VVVPEDPYLSPRHVRILWNNGKLVLRDLGSTNGVYLRLAASRDTSVRREGAEVAVPLIDQDMLLVGQQVLRFDVLKEGEGGLGPAAEHGTLLFGSPAAPRYARLCQRTVEGIARDVYYIRKVETVLGRESGDVVFTEDPFLSPVHANFLYAQNQLLVRDEGSLNGVYVRIAGSAELVPGGTILLGEQVLTIEQAQQPEDLPDQDGMMLARRLGAEQAIPLVILTGRADEMDRILGLELGADDYVTKPFSPRELLARLRAVLRRAQARKSVRSEPLRSYRFAGFELRMGTRKLMTPMGELLDLTSGEFSLLAAFVRSPQQILSRDQLLEASRLYDDVYDRSIDVQILRLRRKVEADPSQPRLIRTERGAGYYLDCKVEEA